MENLEQIAADVNKNIDALKQTINAKVDKTDLEVLATKEDVTTISKSLEELDNISKDLQTSLNDLKVKAVEDEMNPIEKVIKDSGVTEKGMGKFTIKANYTTASVTNTTQANRLEGFGQLGHRLLSMYSMFPKRTLSPEHNGVVRYIDWDAATTVRAAAMVAEGGAFPESTATFQEYTQTLEKIGDTIPITEEALRDTSRLAGEVERFLGVNISIVEDTQLLNGNGTAPNIKGIYTYASAYTAAASGITDANIYDLIVKMSENITSGNGSKYRPNFVIMNIADINKFKLKKDSTNNYIVPPFTSESGMVIDGIRVIENNGLTANTLVMGDSRYAEIWEDGAGYEMTVGEVDAQFKSDFKTLKGRKRMLLLVRKADESGFRKCTSISAALTTLAS